MLTESELERVVAALRRAREAEQGRLLTIRRYMRNEADDIYVPPEATDEYRMLVAQSRFNVLPLVVTAVAQNLVVTGFRPTGSGGRPVSEANAAVWDSVWQANRMDARQAGIYRSALTYGAAYATVLPARRPGPGRVVTAKITPWSPLRMTALYEDPVNDEWPVYALSVDRPEDLSGVRPAPWRLVGSSTVRVYDAEHVYTLDVSSAPAGAASPVLRSVEEHGLGVCPVVRYLDCFDLDGDQAGKVEPLLPPQRQLNQTTFSLAMTQQYSAFRQRWATGMAIQEDEDGNPLEPFNAAVNALWQNESPDGRFGDFAESNLAGYLDSRDKILLFVASVAQIPPHNLLVGSGISNISAETLAAIEAGHRRDIEERQTSFGESTEQLLRLAGLATGDTTAWDDTSSQVVWRDTTTRSLGQVIDALGKMAAQLGIPVQALWERIPGVTDQDIARWAEMASQSTVMDELRAMLDDADSRAGEVAGRVDGNGVTSG